MKCENCGSYGMEAEVAQLKARSVGTWMPVEVPPDESVQVLVELGNIEMPWCVAWYIGGEFLDDVSEPLHFVLRWAYVNTQDLNYPEGL